MKKIILLLAITIAFVSCKEDATKKIKQDNLKKAKKENIATREDAPIITFDNAEHDFGEVNEGDKVETTFTFTNTGKSELIITKIKASCGCTVPSNWDRKPIMPGGKSQFTVKFNTKNKPNKQQKTITITSNTNKGKETVRIKAQVNPDPELAQKRAERKIQREKQQKERAANKAKDVSLKAKQLNVAPKK